MLYLVSLVCTFTLQRLVFSFSWVAHGYMVWSLWTWTAFGGGRMGKSLQGWSFLFLLFLFILRFNAHPQPTDEGARGKRTHVAENSHDMI